MSEPTYVLEVQVGGGGLVEGLEELGAPTREVCYN